MDSQNLYCTCALFSGSVTKCGTAVCRHCSCLPSLTMCWALSSHATRREWGAVGVIWYAWGIFWWTQATLDLHKKGEGATMRCPFSCCRKGICTWPFIFSIFSPLLTKLPHVLYDKVTFATMIVVPPHPQHSVPRDSCGGEA